MRLSIRQYVIFLVLVGSVLPVAGLVAYVHGTSPAGEQPLARALVVAAAVFIVAILALAQGVAHRLQLPVGSLLEGTRDLDESFQKGANAVQIPRTGPSDWVPVIDAFNSLAKNLSEAQQRDRQSRRDKERIKEVLDRYVTAEVARHILENPNEVRLGGETKEVTVLLSDLRGFTMLVDNYPPQDVVELLNRYFARMTDIIFGQQGTLDKFMGDSIMALFGAPVSRKDDPERAVLCAVQMQLAMDEFNKENENRNLPPLHMGIGVNTGMVVAGNFGSEKRSQYTVIGDQVNLVSRIEAFSLRGQILLSQGTIDRIGHILDVSEAQLVHVKGKTDPVPLYELRKILGKHELDVPVREFRRYKRLRVDQHFEYFLVHGMSTAPEANPGQILNISEGGLLARSLTQLSPMSNIKFKVPFTFRNRTTNDIYAKVLRISPDQEQWRFNVEFTSILPEDRMMIRNIVADLA